MSRRDILQFAGFFRWERRSPRGLLLSRGSFWNGITNAGLNDILNSGFRQQTQRTYYVGIIDLAGFTKFSATQDFDPADTMTSHPLWAEITAYSQGTRAQWSPGAASGGAIVNGTLFNFTMTANKTAHGFFVVTDSTKGGTGGVLWAAGVGDVDQQMSVGETLAGSYTLTAAAGAGS